MVTINGREYWSPRTPTKTGFAVTFPRLGPSRYGQSSSAQRRRDDRIADRTRDEQIVTLEPDTLVVFQRSPYRVVEVREIPPDLWGEKWHQAFADELDRWQSLHLDAHPLDPRRRDDRPTQETWRDRPVSVVLRPDGKPQAKPVHLRGRASFRWDVLPEHYAVCKACGELPPCSHELTEDKVRAQMVLTEELMAIPAGHCLSCGEAITARMQAARFPGPNLWRPDLGDDSAIFHARQECSYDARRYREKWQAAGNTDVQAELPLEGM
ncbi:hypothetical protein [Streptomyces sp. LUP47B]|uniref:hypothetical protein n=1 Tax=Streptomyces sp. LUP47B TaxID=1890286 RepID=UPI000851D4DF|nr:hypothetical protein [Streptomyces sp. LUP47B]